MLISGKTKNGNTCRIWTNILDRKDASFIVRYKLYEVCYEFNILVKNKKTLKTYWDHFDQGNLNLKQFTNIQHSFFYIK